VYITSKPTDPAISPKYDIEMIFLVTTLGLAIASIGDKYPTPKNLLSPFSLKLTNST
jgi:hypothetical protein